MKFLGPLTKSGYIRIGMLILAFYFSVQWLTRTTNVDRVMLIEDLRATAQDLAMRSKDPAIPLPNTLSGMRNKGLISSELLERCEQAKVSFFPENITSDLGRPVFSLPNQESKATRVTASGLVLK
jgi:hypothetical protein